MNTNSNENRIKKEIIQEFLGEVEKKLPFWLKSEKEELKDVLDELENHIWDRATELANDEEPTLEHIRQVIDHMGSPNKIASEYKHRGKPKLYITEELFPMYTKVLIIITGIIFGFNLLGTLIAIAGNNTASELAAGFFRGLFISLAIAIILVTIQFVMLSKEGYMPRDFDRITSRLPGSIRNYFDAAKKTSSDKEYSSTTYTEESKESSEYKRTFITEKPILQSESISSKETVIDEPKIRILSEQETTITEKPHVIKETIIVKEPRVIRESKYGPKETPYPKRVVKYQHSIRNVLSEGITSMVFGAACVIIAFLPVLEFVGIDLRYWFAISGGITIISGVIKFLRGVVGRIVPLQQGLMFFGLFPTAANIPLYLAVLGKGIYKKPNVFNDLKDLIALIISKMGHVMNVEIAELTISIIVYVLVAFTALALLTEFGKIIRLGAEGFPEKEVKIYR
ncbi:MAG: hypothetical protein JXA54_02765 [Candidatus Heimdallarchaeota archaeon]|nr:hypothetical protein [Candidatus Heimdallarchaeota archaeon]